MMGACPWDVRVRARLFSFSFFYARVPTTTTREAPRPPPSRVLSRNPSHRGAAVARRFPRPSAPRPNDRPPEKWPNFASAAAAAASEDEFFAIFFTVGTPYWITSDFPARPFSFLSLRLSNFNGGVIVVVVVIEAYDEYR